jgi:uncharacterized protein YdcH (DUF465 family)
MAVSSPLARFRRLLEKHGIYDDAIKLLREHQQKRLHESRQKLREDHTGVKAAQPRLRGSVKAAAGQK